MPAPLLPTKGCATGAQRDLLSAFPPNRPACASLLTPLPAQDCVIGNSQLGSLRRGKGARERKTAQDTEYRAQPLPVLQTENSQRQGLFLFCLILLPTLPPNSELAT